LDNAIARYAAAISDPEFAGEAETMADGGAPNLLFRPTVRAS
jgi:hypothetical protein